MLVSYFKHGRELSSELTKLRPRTVTLVKLMTVMVEDVPLTEELLVLVGERVLLTLGLQLPRPHWLYFCPIALLFFFLVDICVATASCGVLSSALRLWKVSPKTFSALAWP